MTIKKFSLVVMMAAVLAFGSLGGADYEVVTTIPAETSLNNAGTRSAAVVWLEMIQAARMRIDLAEFYLVSQPGTKLEKVIQAIEAAAGRGVTIRILYESRMAVTYPEVLERLRPLAGVSLRQFNWTNLSGGILHAKYFIVDGRQAYIGSQNFDWRSLEHIHETGLRITQRRLVRAIQSVFDRDWNFHGGGIQAYDPPAERTALAFPKEAFLAASPSRFNPPGVGGALESLIGLLDQARKKITVQLLSYETGDAAERFRVIDDALRRAASRGVRVRLLVSDWNLRPPGINDLKGLARVANLEVRVAVIPPSRGGFIPYARVIHSKVLRVDEKVSWISTSNWAYDYFFRSRNLEVVLFIPKVAKTLDTLFESLWNSPYVFILDPDKEYLPPRIS